MGRQVRVNLHQLSRPDELLAWVEFYEQVARQSLRPQTVAPAFQAAPEAQPADLTGASGPVDPWGAGRGGDLAASGANETNGSQSQPSSSQPGSKATKKFSGPEHDEIDPRIRAVLQDQAPSQPPAVYQDGSGQGAGRGLASGNLAGGFAAADQYGGEDDEETAKMPAAAPDEDATEEWPEQQDWSEWSRPPLPRYGPAQDNRPGRDDRY
jgi:hypothetical protein